MLIQITRFIYRLLEDNQNIVSFKRYFTTTSSSKVFTGSTYVSDRRLCERRCTFRQHRSFTTCNVNEVLALILAFRCQS